MTELDNITLEIIGEDLVAIMPLIHNKLMHFLDEGIEPNLSHFHFAILGMLHKHRVLQISEMGRRLLISKPQMTALLNKLSDLGLVTRSQSPQDRRIVYISISPGGEQTLVHATEKIKKNLAVRLGGLSEADLGAFSAALKKINEVGSKIE
jgi:DNA-binding MarR family transcriptional regulator